MTIRSSRSAISDALRIHQSRDEFRAKNHESASQDEQLKVVPCWCISKGMAGMNSQTSGLARAVGFDFEFKDTVMARSATRVLAFVNIVGAGMAIASTACFLADKVDVLLLEIESQPGYHNTGRSVALISEAYSN